MTGSLRERTRHLARRRYGTPQWDVVVRTTGIVAALAVMPVAIWPELAALTGFALVTIPINGPLSPLFPATYEPLLMVMARSYRPWLVAAVGMAAILYVEYLNYHVYRAALLHPRLDEIRRSRLLRRLVVLFRKRPFLAVWLCSWSPLPYWAARILAPLARYPVRPYLLATVLGRFPRLWFFAAIGLAIPVPTRWLLWLTAAMVAAGIAAALIRRARAGKPATTPQDGAASDADAPASLADLPLRP